MNLVLLDEPDSHIHRDMQNRLLRRLENTDVQIFLTSHNDALIRSTKPEFTFHLSAVRQKQYRPISLDPETFKKRGLYPSPHAKILSDLGGNNSLDFVHALESDVLFIVEGVNDAVRLPQIVPRVADKSAFWVIDGADEIFKNLHGIKRIFENIKNEKSLWDKAILVFDKDKMTDKHRLLLMDKFEKEVGKKGIKKLGIKTYIFESANFESVLISEPVVLARLLRIYIGKLTTAQDQIVSEQTLLAQISDAIVVLQTTLRDEIKIKRKGIYL